MTRINLCHPESQWDEILNGEYKELPRIFTMTLSAQRRGYTPDTYGIPSEFTLGTGHMKFFSDKLGYLLDRYNWIIAERDVRGFTSNFRRIRENQIKELKLHWFNGYTPTPEALAASNARIVSNIRNSTATFHNYGERVTLTPHMTTKLINAQ